MSEILNELMALAEPEYQVFSKKLIPGDENILGVRLSKLRQIAKRLSKEDWRRFADSQPQSCLEEKLVWGMMLGYVKTDFETVMPYIEAFVPVIDSWSVCDSFCNTLKIFRRYPEEGWEFLQTYACSRDEYKARFAFVMYLNHFIDDDHVSMILKAVRNMKADGYYAKMAAAWLAAECAVNYTGLVVELLKEETLDAFVHNKTISKMCESYKIPQDVKQHVRSMRVNSIVGGGKQI